MIVGVGNDIIEIQRFESINDRFINKIYTLKEIELLQNKPHRLAGNFAVKEAVSKVLGTGFSSGIVPYDIEVTRDLKGKPICKLYGNAKIRAEELGIDKIHISISHCKLYAEAVAIGERVNL